MIPIFSSILFRCSEVREPGVGSRWLEQEKSSLCKDKSLGSRLLHEIVD